MSAPTLDPAPERVALVRLSALGDVTHALPVFHALRARWPASRLAWVCQPEFAGLLHGLPGLAQVIPFERQGGARAWWRLWRDLRAFGPELVVDAQGNWKSALASRLSGASRRLGLAPVDWRESSAAWSANLRAAPAAGAHALDRMGALCAALGSDSLRLDPVLSAAELAAGESRAKELVRGPRPVLLALSRPGDPRSWPEARWGELAAALLAEGRGVLLLEGPAEPGLAERLAARLGETALLSLHTGDQPLRELVALFAAAAARGATLVGVDSGPSHLAASVGLSVVVLEGPCDERRTGPWPVPERAPSPHRVVRSSDPPDCAPCLARRCAHARGPVCMSELEPQLVLAACGSAQ